MTNSCRNYFHGFDLLRAAAVFAVVWIHGCDTNPLARTLSVYASFAVPVFILMSFFLMQRSILLNPGRDAGQILSGRLKRLLPAYLIWSALYMVVRIAKHHFLQANSENTDWISVIFMGGASYQLYFIAALIYWSVLFMPVMLLCGRRIKLVNLAAFILALIGIVLLFLGPRISSHIHVTAGYSLVKHALGLTGYVPLGMSASLLWSNNINLMERYPADKFSIIFLVLSIVLFVFKPDWGIPALSSALLFLWGIHYGKNAIPTWIKRISMLSFGIFMVHGFFIEGLQMACSVSGHPVHEFIITVCVILLSFILSYILCEMIHKLPKLRWLVQ